MNAHHSLRKLYCPGLEESPPGGKIQFFLENWRKLTSDPIILGIVQGWDIPFLSTPHQTRTPREIQFSRQERDSISEEIKKMLAKKAIRKVQARDVSPNQVLSNIFTRPKDQGFRMILNLKRLNQQIPYFHFKMEGLRDLKNILRPNDLMVKVDLSDAFWSVPISHQSRKYMRFNWEGTLYEFCVLAFGLGPAPRIFTKILKVPISILRKLSIRLIIYIDDILIVY